jgi:hypothetical protein
VILCRRCTTRFDDDSLERCSNCDADLTGSDGLRLPPSASKPTFADRPVQRPPERPIERPVERPIEGTMPPTGVARTAPPEPPHGEPLIEVHEPSRSASETSPAAARRRGRRPGEQDETELEPLSNEVIAPVDAEPAVSVPKQEVSASGRTGDDPSAVRSAPAAGGPVAKRSTDAAPAVQPAEIAAARVPAAVGVTLLPGEVACGVCHRANDGTKRFCRYCATTLPAFEGDELDEPDQPGRDSLIRRLLGTTHQPGRDSRTFAQRAKDSGQRKLKYRAKYTLKSKLRAVGFVGGGVVGLFVMLGPLKDRVEKIINPPDAIKVELVAESDTPAIATFGAENAFDEDPKTAFVMPWIGVPVSFTVQLPADGQVRQLEFETGFPNEDVDRGSLYLRPATLLLEAGGELQTIELDDHEGAQRVKFDLPDDTTTINVTILTVHERSWTTYERVAIAEVGVVF